MFDRIQSAYRSYIIWRDQRRQGFQDLKDHREAEADYYRRQMPPS